MRSWIVPASLTAAGLALGEPARAQDAKPEPTAGSTTALAGATAADTTHLTVPWLLSGQEPVQSSFGTGGSTGLALHLDHDFMVAGVPMTLETSGPEDADHTAGDALPKMTPIWQSQLTVHLRANFLVGGAVETRAAQPSTMSFVVGKKF
jgi:hypothetical protein